MTEQDSQSQINSLMKSNIIEYKFHYFSIYGMDIKIKDNFGSACKF